MLEYAIRFVKNFLKNDVMGTSAQTAFYLILSIPPLMVLAISVSINVIITDTIFSVLEFVFPAYVSDIFATALSSIPKSSGITVISAVGVIFSASGSIWALMRGIHKSYTQEPLNYSIKNRLLAIVFTVVFILSITISLGSVIIGGVLTALIDKISNDTFLYTVSKRIIALASVYAFVYSLYRFTPGVKMKGRQLFWGALFSAFGWVLVSMLFGYYISYFTKYTTVYGGISAFFILILWLYVISLIILTGAQINETITEIENS